MEKAKSSTYFFKQKFTCPVCGEKIEREAMMSGGGRLIAGELTDELRRIYESSKKYGEVFPVLYPISVCPNCNLALFHEDFDSIPKSKLENVAASLAEIDEKTQIVFPHFKKTGCRNLFDGAGAYYSALQCYDKLAAEFSPTVKKAIISLRLAWICDELNKILPERNYDFIRDSFYAKAEFFYSLALERESSGEEPLPKVFNYGPDVDKNYGFDGLQYISAVLTFKYFPKNDMNARIRRIEEKKVAIARIFGLGKSSKTKPGPLLEKTRDLYEKLRQELKDAYSINAEAFGDLDLE